MQPGLIFKSNEHLVDVLSFRLSIGQIQWFQFLPRTEFGICAVLSYKETRIGLMVSLPRALCSVVFLLSSLNSAYSCNFLIWQLFVLVKTVESRRKALIFNYSRRKHRYCVWKYSPMSLWKSLIEMPSKRRYYEESLFFLCPQPHLLGNFFFTSLFLCASIKYQVNGFLL